MSAKGFLRLDDAEDILGLAVLAVLCVFFLTGLWYVVIKAL
jgi:hypothetical protein